MYLCNFFCYISYKFLKNLSFRLTKEAYIEIKHSENRIIYRFGRSSLTYEKDHHYFLNRFVCVGEFFDG